MSNPGPMKLPQRGQFLFALLFIGFAGFLVLSYPGQTTWVDKTKLFEQPGFWPAVSVGGMALFTGLHLLRLPSRRMTSEDRAEGFRWLKSFEFALWFLAYVWLVPRIGYVFASLLFVPVLSMRAGYRSLRWAIMAAVFAVIVVVLFKGFLDVKIPGGAIYDYFPGALRSFFILNL